MTDTSPPDQRAFQAEVAKPLFLAGVVDGRWRLVRLAWPVALIGIAAKDGNEYVLRLDCTGYPRLTAADIDKATAFERSRSRKRRAS